MSKKQFNFIDLFSGCGGFSTGMELAGHKCLLGVDFNKHAVETFNKNHKHATGLCLDIHNLKKSDLKKYIDIDSIDMVIGGPPCQGFSTVGKGSADDERNSLFKQFVRIVKIVNPKIVLFENVTGMLAQKNQKTLDAIYKSFEKLGYTMDARVMSAEEYGVPSKRRRTILMGVKNGECRFPVASHGERGSEKLITVKKALKNLKTPGRKLLNHELDLATIKNELDFKRLKCIPAGRGIRYERDEKEFLPKRLRYGIDWNEISEKRFRQTRLQRIPLDTVAPTILTSRSMYYHPIESRYLTPREAARLQSFPNDFEFMGSTTAQFRQIGNAVPPMLAHALGQEIKNIKFNRKTKKKEKTDKNAISKSAFSYQKNTYI